VLIHLGLRHVSRRHDDRSASNFLAAPDHRVRSWMVLCENRASHAAPRQIRPPPPRKSGSRWANVEIPIARLPRLTDRLNAAGRRKILAGTKLSKPARGLSPSNRQRGAASA
jgi:hypothetical protein